MPIEGPTNAATQDTSHETSRESSHEFSAGSSAGKPKVIILTGMPASGKGELAAMAEKRGCLIKRMGDLIWEETERRGLDKNPQNVGRVASEMRETHGPAIWARRTLDWLNRERKSSCDEKCDRKTDSEGKGNEEHTPAVIVDGSRSLAELECFRDELGAELLLVCVHTSPDTRFERMKARGRSDDSTAREVFDDRDRRELGWGIGSLIALADVIIINEEGIEELRSDIGILLDSWGIPG